MREASDDRTVYEIADPQGGKYSVSRGDPVRIKKPRQGEFGFRARFMWATLGDDGEVDSVTVYGGRGYDPARHYSKQKGRAEYRTLRPESLNRMAKTRGGRKVTR